MAPKILEFDFLENRIFTGGATRTILHESVQRSVRAQNDYARDFIIGSASAQKLWSARYLVRAQ